MIRDVADADKRTDAQAEIVKSLEAKNKGLEEDLAVARSDMAALRKELADALTEQTLLRDELTAEKRR